MLWANLWGRYQVLKEAGLKAEDIQFTDTEVKIKWNPEIPFTEAIEFFNDKVPMKYPDILGLWDRYHQSAFGTKTTANLELIQILHDNLKTILHDGGTQKDFRDQIKDIVNKNGFGELADHRLDNIFRTNIQSAYNVGRYQQMTAPEILQVRPYWQYDAVNDKRTRPAHAVMDGKVYLATDKIWDVWYPPNGYQCRCKIITLAKDEGEKLARRTQPAAGKPDEGFEYNPANDQVDRPRWIDWGRYRPQDAKTIQNNLKNYNATTTVEAEGYARNVLKIAANYNGLDISAVNEINRSIEYTLAFHPGIERDIKYAGTWAGAKEVYVSENLAKRVIKTGAAIDRETAEHDLKLEFDRIRGNNQDAKALYWNTLLIFNEIHLSPDKINATFDNYSRGVQLGFNANGADNYKGLAFHELGHLIDEYYNLSEDPLLKKAYYVNFIISRSEDKLSNYASKNINEMIAEAFMETQAAQEPRELAKGIRDTMNQAINNKRGI